MLLIGLTGSLATGKSTVSSLLSSQHSLPIIDADVLARRAVDPGTHGYKKVVQYFGPSTPDLLLPRSSFPNTPSTTTDERTRNHHSKEERKGRPINRAALGRRIFGRTPPRVRDRAYLNSIIHPRVRYSILLSILHHYIRGSWAVVLDIPLLYDSGLDIFCPVVLMVAVRDPGVQMRRLRSRDQHLSEREAEERVGSQGGVEEKVRRTRWRDGVLDDGGGKVGEEGRSKRGYVVWNDAGKEELEKEVADVMREVEKGRKGFWRWVFLLLWPLAILWGLWEIYKGWQGRRAWERHKRENEKRQ